MSCPLDRACTLIVFRISKNLQFSTGSHSLLSTKPSRKPQFREVSRHEKNLLQQPLDVLELDQNRVTIVLIDVC